MLLVEGQNQSMAIKCVSPPFGSSLCCLGHLLTLVPWAGFDVSAEATAPAAQE